MSAVVRLALVAGLLLLAGGTLVTPHESVAGWSHQQLDHPPGSLHSAVLGHLAHDAPTAEGTTARAGFSELAPAYAVALFAITLAVLAAPRVRVWRPSPGAVHRPAARLGAAQLVLAPPRLPPRASFPL